MSRILWAEDDAQYIEDFILELRDQHGLTCTVVRTCSELLSSLKSLDDETRVIILDLWLPIGPEERGIPANLKSSEKNTERGLWLCEEVLKSIKVNQLSTSVVVLSGNADANTIEELEKMGIPKRLRWKKPADFDPFLELLLSLSQRPN